MKPASVSFVGSLPVLALLVSTMAMAGGGHNSTSPAMGTVQLASILCNVSSGSSPQGYVRNNSLSAPVGATHLSKSGLCRSLAAQHSSQNHKGKHKAIGRHYGREASRTLSHNRVATNAVGPHKSRDSFKQETWFMPDGSKQRRVTKHQARKQGWSGPEAMQAAHQSGLDAMPTDAPLMAQLQASDSPADSAQSVSRLVPAMASLVTEGSGYDGVETGLYKRQGQAPVPFKMVRNHGVIAIPQFEPGSDSAVASAGAEPKILVKKFRMVDGVMQLDNSFSDDGMEDFAVPLPAGDRVTAFTLDQDKLVVLSRPEADQELSRVTLININEEDSAELVDSGASSGLWVKGELFRFHDNALYTLSQEDQKLFIYPDLASSSTQSLSSARVVDLSSVDLSDGELVSVLADGETCHLAVRKSDPASDASRIHLYQIDATGTLTKETVVTGVEDQNHALLHFQKGEAILFQEPAGGSGISNLTLPGSVDEKPDTQQPGKSIQKRAAMSEEHYSAAAQQQGATTCENPTVLRSRYDLNCTDPLYAQCHPCAGSEDSFCVTSGGCGNGNCTFIELWASTHPACIYYAHATCGNCTAVLFYTSLFDTNCLGGTGFRLGVARQNPPGCLGSGSSSTGPAVILVAVSAGLSAAALTTGFAGNEAKKRSEHDEPMEQGDDPAQM